jgi:hypothetical protein
LKSGAPVRSLTKASDGQGAQRVFVAALDRESAHLGEQMPIGVLVVGPASGFVDDGFRHVAHLQLQLDGGDPRARGRQACGELRRLLDRNQHVGLALAEMTAAP